MRIFLLIALVLFVLAALVSMGAQILTGWNVWMLWGFVALTLDFAAVWVGPRLHQ